MGLDWQVVVDILVGVVGSHAASGSHFIGGGHVLGPVEHLPIVMKMSWFIQINKLLLVLHLYF